VLLVGRGKRLCQGVVRPLRLTVKRDRGKTFIFRLSEFSLGKGEGVVSIDPILVRGEVSIGKKKSYYPFGMGTYKGSAAFF